MMSNKFYQKMTKLMPKKLVYFCTIRLIAYATTGKYSDTIVPTLTAMDALNRWEE